MTRATTIGVDLGKNVMQVHGVDADGRIVVAQPLRRKQVLAFFEKVPPCLVGMEDSSGGKAKQKGISKKGDRYLRQLLVNGAMAVIRQARRRPDKYPWVAQLLARMPAKAVAIALANKTARIARASPGRSWCVAAATKPVTAQPDITRYQPAALAAPQ